MSRQHYQTPVPRRVCCPSCGGDTSRILHTDPSVSPPGVTRRRRECLQCQTRFTTYESRVPLEAVPSTAITAR